MSEIPPQPDTSDVWSEWLLERRHGGDAEHAPRINAQVNRFRDRVLDGAQLAPGMTLVDVGAGDGLIAFRALERIGRSLEAVFVDVSRPLLDHAALRSVELGLRDRCTFIEASAESLAGVEDASADAVTTRAVLAYVGDKRAAARSFHRVLKQQGRLSIAEPINRDEAVNLAAFSSYLHTEAGERVSEAARLLHRCRKIQMPSTLEEIERSPVTNFSERDLVALFQNAGFGKIHLELHIDIRRQDPISWGTYIDIAPRPGAPSLREAFASELNEAEQRLIERALRPLVESGRHKTREATAYLTACKAD